MTQEDLAMTLRDMAARVAAGDSFEGSIRYLMPTEEDARDGAYAVVAASYRIGNTMGQGGVRLIGAESMPATRERRNVKHEIQVLNKEIPDGEPLFLLRGQDRHAPTAIDDYAVALEVRAGQLDDAGERMRLEAQALEARGCALEMRRWQHENQDRVKDPD
jgi:hypothetical protein